MTDTIFEVLRKENNFQEDQLAAALGISVDDYQLIEKGITKISYEQAGILGKFYGLDAKHLLGVSESINYNFGSHSRTIYTQVYHEASEHKDKSPL